MKKVVIFSILVFSLLLISCGKNNIQGMSVLDVENKNNEVQQEKTFQEEQTRTEQKTAIDMLDELKKSTEIKQESKTGTFYGEIDISTEGKDALKEKTKALFEKEFFNLSVIADKQQGARYY